VSSDDCLPIEGWELCSPPCREHCMQGICKFMSIKAANVKQWGVIAMLCCCCPQYGLVLVNMCNLGCYLLRLNFYDGSDGD